MGIYMNECTLKTCGLIKDEFDKVKFKKYHGIDVIFTEEHLIGKIRILNNDGTEEEFLSLLNKINEVFKEYIYIDDDKSVEEVLIEMLIERGERLSIAESITAGLICAKLANVPGCSKVLYEGIVAYDSKAKVRRLHVSSKTIEDHGAVSQETLEELLNGLLANKEIDYAIATTGCAGPTSNKKEIPVGLAYLGVSSRQRRDTLKKIYDGGRNDVRESVANMAIFKLIKLIENNK